MTEFVSKLDPDSALRAAFVDTNTRALMIAQLVRRRIELGLTQTDVAERLNRRQSTVAAFEKEDSNPRLATVLRYARAVEARVIWKVIAND